MIYLKTPQEMEQMRKACDLVSRTLGEMAKWISPGVTTHRLDTIAREFILGLSGFPGDTLH